MLWNLLRPLTLWLQAHIVNQADEVLSTPMGQVRGSLGCSANLNMPDGPVTHGPGEEPGGLGQVYHAAHACMASAEPTMEPSLTLCRRFVFLSGII